MCYSKLTLKGTFPVINERYKFSYLKVTGETKMTQNMDINFEQTLTIFRYYFFKAYGTFVVRIKLKRWMPLTRKFLDFSYKIIVLHKYMYVITIFSLLCFVWWLSLTGLSWISYIFGCAACLETPSSSGTIHDAHICCWWL